MILSSFPSPIFLIFSSLQSFKISLRRKTFSVDNPQFSKLTENVMRGFNLLFTENKISNSMTPSSSSKENSNKNLGGKVVPQGLGVIIALRQIQRGTKALNNLFILRGKHISFNVGVN